jgi:hypothetical protein
MFTGNDDDEVIDIYMKQCGPVLLARFPGVDGKKATRTEIVAGLKAA